jgi:peptidoglycan/xylan/chitin deacetylase (PgdA/CDA1 family)/ubiquinone/menaquinone biosynthesis C-methylase UbiE
MEIDLERSLEDITPPEGAERLVRAAAYAAERLAALELPVCDGVVSAEVLSDALTAECGWRILGGFFASTIYPQLACQLSGGTWRAQRGDVVLAEEPRMIEPGDVELHDAVGWTVLLQEAWGRVGWPAARFYDPLAESIAGPIEQAPVGEPLLVDIAEDPVSVCSDDDVTVIASAGGSVLGLVAISPIDGIVSSSAIRAAVATELGYELVNAVVRGALVGRPLSEGRTLRERLAEGATTDGEPGATESELLVLHRRRPFALSTPASRRAALPSQAAAELLRAAAATGEDCSGVTEASEVRRVFYLPDRLPRADTLSVGAHPAHPPAAEPADRVDYGRHHWESLFALGPDPWDYTSPYEQTKYEQTLELLPREARGAVLELACAEGHFTVQLAPEVERLVAADVSAIALERARERCSAFENVEFARLDLITDPLPARGFDAIICSEVLYYVELDALGDVAKKLARAVRPGGYTLLTHANLVSDDPELSGFDWGLPFGARTIGEAFSSARGLRLVRETRTPLYRVQLFRRERPFASLLRQGALEITEMPQPTDVSAGVKASVRWAGGQAVPLASEPVLTSRLPILMYHRVTAEGAPELARYRVSPDAFDEQLRYLRESGYRSVSLEELREAMHHRRPLPGRRVLLTFDDAYEDFLEEAWPCLRRHGFGAVLFVVTERVGGTAEWDRELGEQARLLGWEQLRRLLEEGVEIGGHSATHPRLTALPPGGMVAEAARSRAAIAEQLGVIAEAFAYPYGDHDAVVEHLIGACGYSMGLTIRGEHAELGDRLLALPRFEVSGSMDLQGFIRCLEGDIGLANGGHEDPNASEERPAIAYEPQLLPPLQLMRTEGIDVLEEWFRWGEEWSFLLRVYGGLARNSSVLEIGCGLGRIAFALRYLLSPGGTYDGFEVVKEKVEFLEKNFIPRYPNFRFVWADVKNTHYNPTGATLARDYRFLCEDDAMDIVFAASVFTHTLPEVARRYFHETARVLRPGGRAVFSFFLLDHYRPAIDRPPRFDHPRFDLEHEYASFADDFRIANPRSPEEMTGFRRSFVEAMAAEAGLELREIVPSYWSGSFAAWIASQDVVVLEKPS